MFLYKLINKINPVRFRSIAGGLALLSILALPGCSLLEPEKMPPKPANPTGVSGKHDPQAEQLFAKAHVLWKGETCTDPEKALEYLDEALKDRVPHDPQALIRRGLALSQLGYADGAFDDSDESHPARNPPRQAYLSRGICLLQQGNAAGPRQGSGRSSCAAMTDRIACGTSSEPAPFPQRGRGARGLRGLRKGLLLRRLRWH